MQDEVDAATFQCDLPYEIRHEMVKSASDLIRATTWLSRTLIYPAHVLAKNDTSECYGYRIPIKLDNGVKLVFDWMDDKTNCPFREPRLMPANNAIKHKIQLCDNPNKSEGWPPLIPSISVRRM